MKKYVLLVIVSVMVLAILTACGKTPAAQAPVLPWRQPARVRKWCCWSRMTVWVKNS